MPKPQILINTNTHACHICRSSYISDDTEKVLCIGPRQIEIDFSKNEESIFRGHSFTLTKFVESCIQQDIIQATRLLRSFIEFHLPEDTTLCSFLNWGKGESYCIVISHLTFDYEVISVDFDPVIYELKLDSDWFMLGDTPYTLYKYACRGCEEKEVAAYDLVENPFKIILRGEATLKHFRDAERIFEKPEDLGIKIIRLCKCGCGRPVPANSHSKREYADPKKCGSKYRQKAHRNKQILNNLEEQRIGSNG